MAFSALSFTILHETLTLNVPFARSPTSLEVRNHVNKRSERLGRTAVGLRPLRSVTASAWQVELAEVVVWLPAGRVANLRPHPKLDRQALREEVKGSNLRPDRPLMHPKTRL